MENWLSNIIKEGTLVDNQQYFVSDGLLTSTNANLQIRLKAKAKREHTKVWNDNESVWWFLLENTKAVNTQLSNSKDSNITLFNEKEYEHNSDDDFFKVSGYNAYNFSAQSGNIIGYLKKDNYALKISSRFGDQFLKYIIADADGFLEIENYGGQENNEGFEWLLIYLWKIKLKKALRLGLPKQYVSKTRTLNKVKGNVHALDYFLTKEQAKYKCTYREHSYNNPTVRLIASVFELLKGNSFVRDMHQIRSSFLISIGGVKTNRRELLATKNETNPFYQEYNEVIELSKRIIKNDVATFGELSETSAFFFDVSMLFEYFIKKLLIRNGFKMLSKFNSALTIETGTYQRKLQPDLLFEDEKGFYVFDVKYKAFDKRYGVKREDLFQLHTYIGQYGNDNKIKGCGFIYPSREKENKIITRTINMMGVNISFYICLLAIPDEKDGIQFNKLFKSKCEQFVFSLKEKLNTK
ncbi:5-methylcytosine restriction system specificity protein McrC [Lacinutrix mariniflava]|uniref:5-methylcytosine restriction system specificity protein McrC n=1 Tax=Lacinutrix mariniflava TaxID=342955 RepID=UPI0006E2D0B4|nr:restriction endonuclease [Lacinutrix mariniflava]